MKRLISFVAVLVALGNLANGQDKIAFRQYLDKPVRKIIINSGWHVQLVPRSDDSIFLEQILDADEATPEMAENSIFDYDDKTLTLRRAGNAMLGKRVKIHANFRDLYTVIQNGATVFADSLTLGQKKSLFKVYSGSILKVGKLNCLGYCTNDINVNKSDLIVDTLCGDELNIDVYGDGHVSVNHYLQHQLYIRLHSGHGTDCYTFPDASLVAQNKGLAKTEIDTVNHIEVNDEDKRIFSERGYLGITLGLKVPSNAAGWNSSTGWFVTTSGAPLESAYAHLMSFELNMPLCTDFRLNKRLQLRTGLNLQYTFTPTYNNVEVDQNGYLQLCESSTHFSSLASSMYLGIPVALYYKLPWTDMINLSIDLFAGVKLGGELSYFEAIAEHQYKMRRDKTRYLNPFKLELGFNFNQKFISTFMTERFYINLLPDYRNDPALPKCHTFGLEIRF